MTLSFAYGIQRLKNSFEKISCIAGYIIANMDLTPSKTVPALKEYLELFPEGREVLRKVEEHILQIFFLEGM